MEGGRSEREFFFFCFNSVYVVFFKYIFLSKTNYIVC